MRSFLLLAAAALAAEAFTPRIPMRRPRPPLADAASKDSTDDDPSSSGPHQASFAQLIDHSNPSLGTFPVRYWYDTTSWRGPGSPIVFETPGESDASGYTFVLGNRSMDGRIAAQIGAATVLLEHRYFGKSIPVENLTTANMKYLTLENSMQDLVYFARNVQLPFAREADCGSTATDVPWVILGGSYAASLAAWIATLYPDTFWAYYASSAPKQNLHWFWQFWTPVQKGMPQDCRQDVNDVIDHMDEVLEHGSEEDVAALKARFDMPAKLENDDFMNSLAQIVGQGWTQRGFAIEAAKNAARPKFLVWCDYIEDRVDKGAHHDDSVDHAPVGVDAALDGYARWWKEFGLDWVRMLYDCAANDTDFDCFNTHGDDVDIHVDWSLDDSDNITAMSYLWMVCSFPFENFYAGPPKGIPALISRLITPESMMALCPLAFPPGPNGELVGVAKGLTADNVNRITGGWEVVNSTRLVYVNGEFDGWRELSVSSDYRPAGPLPDSLQVPAKVVSGGFHCSDLSLNDGDVNEDVRKVQDEVVAQLVKWVGEWPGKKDSGQ
ncbi:unnamed protein product [Zymoseptoria tritici ST99CH_3D7]|uniref:Serine carboxypeptidase S28 n=1 Tax=Zymoseptoria tritici (strain ST99CH_3D7) TaxID=1276538 RepID=A0A1X7RT21_ZYMT9|nr:unnamed protein product [Zymoseptoria tritici ST99CH_3D7]